MKEAVVPVLNRIAYFQNRRDEHPNQALARELADKNDRAGIREIAENLWNKEKNIRSDCIKVLYETGYLAPALIADYVDNFLKLLHDKNNRMVWGGMIALSTIADIKADALFPQVEKLKKVMDRGTVITKDAGVRALAGIAAQDEAYQRSRFPDLLDRIANCRPKDVARYAEGIAVAVNAGSKSEFIVVLENRKEHLSKPQIARVEKVITECCVSSQ